MAPKAKSRLKASKGESLGAGPVSVKELEGRLFCSSETCQFGVVFKHLCLKSHELNKSFLGAGDPTDVQTRSLNIDIMAEVKHAWDSLMAPLGNLIRSVYGIVVEVTDYKSSKSTSRSISIELRSDEFNGIQKESPLPPQKGGVYHPTDLKLIKVTNEAGRTYTAGANLSWVSPFWTPCSIPVIRSAVHLLMSSKWREPRVLELEVMVSTGSDPNNQQHRLGSLLKRLSPEEDHISYVLATWRDVAKGENIEDRGDTDSEKNVRP